MILVISNNFEMKDENLNPKSKVQQESVEWVQEIARVFIYICIGFLLMIGLSLGLSRQSTTYNAFLMIFVLYLLFCVVYLIKTVIKGVKIKFGDGFNRKMYLYNPKKNYYETVFDDGSYVIRNDTVIGRQNFDTAEHIDKMNVKMHWEPKLIYMARFAMLTLGFLAIFFVIFTLIVTMVYFIILLTI